MDAREALIKLLAASADVHAEEANPRCSCDPPWSYSCVHCKKRRAARKKLNAVVKKVREELE